MSYIKYFFPIIILLVNLSCFNENKPIPNQKEQKQDNFVSVPEEEIPEDNEIIHPEWAKNASVYEINIRHYTAKGTFNAFYKYLPRIKKLGPKILCFMPIQPIGQKKRKGEYGNPYSVRDYKSTNPDYGTLEDFKKIVDFAHNSGIRVIIDWPANHTSWDNILLEVHPEWYETDRKGNIISPPGTDWTDLAQLKYKRNRSLWDYMTGAMKFWLTQTDIDGFRCESAEMVPVRFWKNVREELNQIKPIFLIAEGWDPSLNKKAFNCTYGWQLHHIMNQIARGKKDVEKLDNYMDKMKSVYRKDDYILNFTSNHDENAMNGSAIQRLHNGIKPFTILAFTSPGMPMLFNGQEAGLDRELNLYKKETINWENNDYFAFYQTLFNLKSDNPALWNGKAGGKLERLKTTEDLNVFAFLREKGKNKVVVILNLSDEYYDIRLKDRDLKDEFIECFTNKKHTFGRKVDIELEPWDHQIYVHSGK